MPTGLGRVTLRAESTVAAVGQEREAAVGEGTVGGVAVTEGVAATLELPQADRNATNRNATRVTRDGLLDNTVERCYSAHRSTGRSDL
jgi:hypothetical protein